MATKKALKFEDIFEKVKKEFGTADVSNYEDFLALQINVTGEGEGAFYAKIENGTLDIQPYDYKDNNVSITASGNDLIDIFAGKLDIAKAYENGKLTVEGDMAKALSIVPVIENNKKPASKKAAAPAKKAAPAASKKAAAKTDAKAVKETAKKTTTKAAPAAKKAATTKKKG